MTDQPTREEALLILACPSMMQAEPKHLQALADILREDERADEDQNGARKLAARTSSTLKRPMPKLLYNLKLTEDELSVLWSMLTLMDLRLHFKGKNETDRSMDAAAKTALGKVANLMEGK